MTSMQSKYIENEQKQEVLKQYEIKREQIYKELEIMYVQQKIRNRLLKKESRIVELLFCDSSDLLIEESIESQEIEDLISESAEDKQDSNEMVKEEIKECESIDIKKIENDKAEKLSKGLFNYLDLEADYSGNESDEETNGTDIGDLIDNNENNEIKLDHFVNEREKNDELILKKLKERFIKKPKIEKHHDFEILDFESNEDFPEIREFDIEEICTIRSEEEEPIAETPTINTSDLNKKIKVNEVDIFNNESEALKKLSKKDEKKTVGFTENFCQFHG
jgi:hypothetical protein